MSEDNLQPKAPLQDITSGDDAQYTESAHVFDISSDNISPADDEPIVPVAPQVSHQNIGVTQSTQQSRPVQNNQVKQNRPYIPPDADLLDKKIGTFDATPFAPAKNVPLNSASVSVIPKVPVQQLKAVPAFNSNLSRPGSTPPANPTVPTKVPLNPAAQNQSSVKSSQTPPSYREPIEKPVTLPAINKYLNKLEARRPKPEPSLPVPPAPVSTSQLITPQQPAPKEPAPPAPQQPITLVQKKPQPIPIQDISVPINKIKDKSLQNEAMAALPSSLRPKTPEQPSVINTIKDQTENANKPLAHEERMYAETAKPLRTYEGDVAEVMSHTNTSRASIAIAETKKQDGEEKISNEEPSHAGKKITMVILSILLLGGGAFGAYYLYSISPLAPVAQITSPQNTIKSIIPSDSQVALVIDAQNPIAIQTRIQNEIIKTQAPHTIKEIIPVTKDVSGNLTRIDGPGMVRVLDINAPDILVRSMAHNWMLGVYADANSDKSVFVVVTSTFFQNTFAGMLQWESVMADDLKQYLYPLELSGISNSSAEKDGGVIPYTNPLDNLSSILPNTASSSATSTKAASTTALKNIPKVATSTKNTSVGSTTPEKTQPLRPYFTLRGKFEDRIVKNKDVREFRTDNGIVLFLYSFIDNNHLVITSNESTLTEILTRLEKQSLIR